MKTILLLISPNIVKLTLLLFLFTSTGTNTYGNENILRAQKIAKEQQQAKAEKARRVARAELRREAREVARERLRVKRSMLKLIRRTTNVRQGCVNCHALPFMTGGTATSAQMIQVNRVVPNHSRQGFSSCTGCHIAGWKTPSTNMDFRNKSKNEICRMLNETTTSHPTVRGHLEGDPLIQWAISGAAFPTENREMPNARSRTSENRQTAWVSDVRTWVLARPTGTPAEKCADIL